MFKKTKIVYLFYYILFFNKFNLCETQNKGDGFNNYVNIKSTTPAVVQAQAAAMVIKRLLPDHNHLFRVHIDGDQMLPTNTFKLEKNETENVLVITATSGVTACNGFYYYLKYYCNAHVSWDGVQLNKFTNNTNVLLPNVFDQRTLPQQFLYYQNVCTWSYSFAWWTWTEWEKHIDWMALMGISLTLAPNQESIWEQIYSEFGMTSDEIDDHFSGPAFFAWQRMGNVRGWGGPLSTRFRYAAHALQKRIVTQLHQLGIVTVLPAFAGHVPIAFKRIFPNVTFSRTERWNRFANEFCCPLFVDPLDDLFRVIGEKFLQKIITEYGDCGNDDQVADGSGVCHTDHIYFSDPFNEIQPAIATPKYLRDVSHTIYETMKTVDKHSVWLLQGWMFVKNPFWNTELLEAFLTGPPIGKLLVLDLQSEIYPQYYRTRSYFGQPFIWNMLHNFGGTLGMHGSFTTVNQEMSAAINLENSTMIGVGITPEGIYQNYIMYEFTLERGWHTEPIDIEKWINHYCLVRYGKVNAHIKNAWHKLTKTVYNYKGLEKISGKYIVCKRPSLKLQPLIWYNVTVFEQAWTELLMAADNDDNQLSTSDLYKLDLIDVTRQFIQNKLEQYYVEIVEAFNGQRLTEFTALSDRFIKLQIDLDSLLASNKAFLLGKWLENAKAMATTEAEQQLFEINARTQITLWGPNGEIVDYAMKQWAGMISDYCMPRWRYFFDQLTINLIHNKSERFNENKFKRNVFKFIEEPFIVSQKLYPTSGTNDEIMQAKNIWKMWLLESESKSSK